MQPLAAEQREALHARAVGAVDLRPAGAPPAPHPPSAAASAAGDAHRRMLGEEVAQHLARHAGRGPRRDVAGRDDAGIGETGLGGDAAAALEHRDLVAVGGELVGGGDADNAGADDGDAHLSRSRVRRQRASIASEASRTVSSCPAPLQTISPTGNSPSRGRAARARSRRGS